MTISIEYTMAILGNTAWLFAHQKYQHLSLEPWLTMRKQMPSVKFAHTTHRLFTFFLYLWKCVYKLHCRSRTWKFIESHVLSIFNIWTSVVILNDIHTRFWFYLLTSRMTKLEIFWMQCRKMTTKTKQSSQPSRCTSPLGN